MFMFMYSWFLIALRGASVSDIVMWLDRVHGQGLGTAVRGGSVLRTAFLFPGQLGYEVLVQMQRRPSVGSSSVSLLAVVKTTTDIDQSHGEFAFKPAIDGPIVLTTIAEIILRRNGGLGVMSVRIPFTVA